MLRMLYPSLGIAKWPLALLLSLTGLHTPLIAALNPGDIALVGMNTGSATDQFAFLVLKPIAAGENIYFTDRGWDSNAGAFSAGEYTLTWTAPTPVYPGALISLNFGNNLSTSGDQILAFQGSPGNPRFIAALNNTPAGWQAGSPNANGSALPPGLIDGFTAVSVTWGVNVRYDCASLNGTPAELLLSIGDKQHWQGRSSNVWDLSQCNFYVNSNGPSMVVGPRPDVNEGAGIITVAVYSDATGPHTAQLVHGAGTATWGQGGDLMYAGSSTVSFVQSQVAYVSLQIIDDNLCEGPEDVCLSLANPVCGIVSLRGVPFTIFDNDGQAVQYAQNFEAAATDNWAYSSNPAPFNSETGADPLIVEGQEHVWSRIKFFANGFSPAAGSYFWGFSDFTGTGWHDLEFATLSLGGLDHGVLSFRYISFNFGPQNGLECWVAYDNNPNWVAAQITPLDGNTRQWVKVTTQVPAGAQYLRLRFRVREQCDFVCGGIDDVRLDGVKCVVPVSISPGTVPSSLCAGSAGSFNFPFTSTGIFLAGNSFIAELSDANGSFTNPTTVGSILLSGNSPQGSIPVSLPANLPAGSGYRIRIRSTQPAHTSPDNGFNIQIQALSVQLTATVYPNGYNLSCPNASDGAIQASVLSGQAPYSYLWSGPNGFSSTQAQISQLQAGLYTLQVSDASGCAGTASINLQAPSLSLLLSSSPISCHGHADGSLTAQVTGSSGPFSYAWTGPNGFSANTASIGNLGPGTYGLVVTDQGGCTVAASQALSEPDSLWLSSSSPQFACGFEISCPAAQDGQIDLTVHGGNGSFQYQWSGPAGFQSNLQDPQQLAPGSYGVTVTDHQGCSATLQTTLDGPSPIAASLSSPVNACGHHVSCAGVHDGSIQLSGLAGGCAPYSILWSNGDTSASLSNLAAGHYSVTITDANGCSIQHNIQLTAPDPITLGADITDATCIIALDGAIDLSVAGGCSGYSFAWSGPNGMSVATEDIDSLQNGNYSITVTDAMGCSASASYTVGLLDDLKASIGCCQDTMICFGDSVAIRVDFSGQGPWMLGYNAGTIPQTVIVNSSPYYLVVSPQQTTQYTLTSLLQNFTDCPGTVCGTATVAVGPCDSSGCEELCVNTGVLQQQLMGNCRTVSLEVACDTICNNKTAIQTGGGCLGLRTLSFNRLPNGQPLPAGTVATNQWAALGISIEAGNNALGHPDSALVFNSAWPTGGDPDLGTPNFSFGGMGMGAGGAAGQPGENAYALGNLLVIAENLIDNNLDGLVDDPGDELAGGYLALDFATPSYIESVKLVDLDNGSMTVLVQRASGAVLSFPVPTLGDNAVTDVLIQTDSVVRLKLLLSGQGALASLEYCPSGTQPQFFDVSIPCGQVTSYSNSAGLPMYPIFNDPISGITGLRVEGLPAYCQDTSGLGPFTVTYTLCDTSCGSDFCLPMVAYGRDGCVQYEDAVWGPVQTPLQPHSPLAHDAPAGLSVAPNPARGSTYAHFYLRERSQASLDLYDMAGHAKLRLWQGEALADYPYSVRIDTDPLPKGVYVLRLQSMAGSTVTSKLVVIH